jgi:hypothetical protein
MTDDFSNHPKSIGEIRSDKLGDGSLWSPRDALIDMLRSIDSGEFKPDALVIAWRWSPEPGVICSSYSNACPDGSTALGLMTRVLYRLNTNMSAE